MNLSRSIWNIEKNVFSCYRSFVSIQFWFIERRDEEEVKSSREVSFLRLSNSARNTKSQQTFRWFSKTFFFLLLISLYFTVCCDERSFALSVARLSNGNLLIVSFSSAFLWLLLAWERYLWAIWVNEDKINTSSAVSGLKIWKLKWS